MTEHKLLEQISKHLQQLKQTLAVAESVTAGLLQHQLASAEFAARFFQGGITVYNIEQKVKHPGIDPVHARQVNCVSRQVAEEMAVQVCQLFNCDWGVGITGYATAVPESNNKRFAYYAIAHQQQVIFSTQISSDQDATLLVQEEYVQAVLRSLLQEINKFSATV
jgi:nicotinamide-nucleotide amidase